MIFMTIRNVFNDQFGRIYFLRFAFRFFGVVFTFALGPALIVQGTVLALLVGIAGGLFPAIRAARTPIVTGLSG